MNRTEWETPNWLFEIVESWYSMPIPLDVCASSINSKCKRYYSKKENGLIQPWEKLNWMNPPFNDTARWLDAAWKRVEKGCTTIALVKNDPSTQWYVNYIIPAKRLIILAGSRVNFLPPEGVTASSCSFPVILAEIGPGDQWGISHFMID